jgi:heme exporter protein C
MTSGDMEGEVVSRAARNAKASAERGRPMKRMFVPLVALTGLLFAVAPYLIWRAPYESTMGLVQKIFYFHVPSWMAMYTAIAVCGVGSAIYLFQGSKAADGYAVAGAEVAVLFGLMGLVSGPLWGRKAWGVWWVWEPRLTSALLMELIFIAYLLVRKYGGPGSEKLAAATGLFGAATSPFVYKSVDIWRTQHPQTTVVPQILKGSLPGAEIPFMVSALAFVLFAVILVMMRVTLARRQSAVDELYLALEDGAV